MVVTKKSAEIAILRKKITKANDDFHNGEGKVSDAVYDAWKDRLATLNPRDPLLKAVGAPIKRAAKVKLPFTMPSLPKNYVSEIKQITDWIKKHRSKSSVVILSDKLDGVSALYGRKNGALFLYTRGDGSIGSDVSHLIPHIKYMPKLKEGQVVRGEILLTKKTFEAFAKKHMSSTGKPFDNGRAVASAMVIKTKEIHPGASVAHFIIHEMVAPAKPLYRVASQLEAMGGKVVKHTVIRGALTVAAITEFLAKRKKTSLYEIDGVVAETDGQRIAIKNVNDVAVVEVKEVTWQLSRFGYLTPVVWFVTPVRLAGVMVSKATGHNAKRIVDEKIGPGAVISVTRQGEVIPKLLETIKGTKASMPPKGTWEWDENKTFIRSINADDKELVKIKKLTGFLTLIGVKAFKEKIITTLYDAGLDTIPKIIRADASRFAAAGLGPTMAKKLQDAIKEQMLKITSPQLMVASGAFSRGFGSTTAKLIHKAISDEEIATWRPAQIRSKLNIVNGLGEVSIQQFMDGKDAYLAFVKSIKWTPPKEVKKKIGNRLAGKKFVFTGFRDATLQAYLETNGATVATGSVSKNTSYVVVKVKTFTSDKTIKANDLGIKVITADAARKL